MPEKSIICAVQKKDDRSVDYYVSDEAILRDILVSYKKERRREDKKELDDIGSILEETVKPISKMKMNYYEGSYIVFKSCLYRIGGISFYKEKFEGKANKIVKKLDLKKMESESDWVRIEDMNWGRVNPQPVILGDELYVVGGLSNVNEESGESAYLMEVLKSDGFGWETIPNPPIPPCGNDFNIYYDVVAGVYKSKNIIVGMSIPSCSCEYSFYIYIVEEKKWEIKTKISSELYSWANSSPRMVWGELIIFVDHSHPYTLCIMDLDLDTLHLHTIDLFQASVIPPITDTDRPRPDSHTFLVMIEPGKFCFFWVVKGPKSSSGEHDILEACIFTLIKNKNKNIKRSCNCNCSCSVHALEATFRVKIESHFSSFIPDLDYHELYAVLLVDYIPQDIISKLQVSNFIM